MFLICVSEVYLGSLYVILHGMYIIYVCAVDGLCFIPDLGLIRDAQLHSFNQRYVGYLIVCIHCNSFGKVGMESGGRADIKINSFPHKCLRSRADTKVII